eukprot:m.464400 g.464400  ORF g.464400 m.464400 type:complete len:110 (-) comp57046_c0_seq15:434-763(-)
MKNQVQLSSSQHQYLANLLNKWSNLFSREGNKMQMAIIEKMPITIKKGARPARIPNHAYRSRISRNLSQLVIDYSQLNDVTDVEVPGFPVWTRFGVAFKKQQASMVMEV